MAKDKALPRIEITSPIEPRNVTVRGKSHSTYEAVGEVDGEELEVVLLRREFHNDGKWKTLDSLMPGKGQYVGKAPSTANPRDTAYNGRGVWRKRPRKPL